jgi:anti-sigma regulatory factor (Ser/Thr protein kinase)
MRSWRRSESFPCAASSPAEGRKFCARNLAEVLAERDGAGRVIADAELIVSELLTNAIRANCSSTQVMLSTSDSALRIEVHDDAEGTPELRHPDITEHRGRGLLIVSALSRRWGVEASNGGKRVWAELALA